MKPVDQTVFGAPDGNCFAAGLASLLDRPLSDFDRLQAIYREGAIDYERALKAGEKASNVWDRSWRKIERLLRDKFEVWPAFITGSFVPRGYALMGGKSPRGDFGHYVVALNGVIVHDPHPSRDGLDGPAEDFLVLVRLMPDV